MHSLKGLLILASKVKKPKWSVFTQTIQSNGKTEFESNIKGLQETYPRKVQTHAKKVTKFALKEVWQYTCCIENLQTVQLQCHRLYDTWKHYCSW